MLFQGSCGDYTSTVGMIIGGSTAAQGSMASTYFGTICSSTQSRWYCLAIDRTAVVQVVPPPARRFAFVTAATWTPGGGLAGADALCQSEATDAGLPGTYRALLASTSASAASRFNSSGSPWTRVDGVAVTSAAAAMFTATYWDASPAVTANGSQYLGNNSVWSGATTVNSVGTAGGTCNNWTSTSGAMSLAGRAGYSWVPGFYGLDISIACNATVRRLACFQL